VPVGSLENERVWAGVDFDRSAIEVRTKESAVHRDAYLA
jgi:hypothetical protein